jgi:sugar transferase (PEP-CTERM/EpsH1 system associated)
MNEIPLIAHLIYVLDFGGLETLLVERINRMPAHKYRHAVICLTKYTDFAKKITRPGVEVIALNKAPGLSPGTHVRLWRELRRLKPTILHTYNLSAIEYGLTGLLAGVPVRVAGSHGREANDPEGTNKKHNLLRRLLIPFYDSYYSNSADLLRWNRSVIGVPDAKNRLLNNGIDTDRFTPASTSSPAASLHGFPPDCCVIGTVGRVQEVKHQSALVDAFILMLARDPSLKARLRLAIVGEGPLLGALRKKVAAAGIADLVWMPGARNDVDEVLRTFSVFVLSSIAEGTPGSILEAMATGLPVVATRVGGIPDVVSHDVTGLLVPPRDPEAMADALARYCNDPALAEQHGRAGRLRVEQHFAMSSMVSAYTGMYDVLCKNKLQGAYKTCVE